MGKIPTCKEHKQSNVIQAILSGPNRCSRAAGYGKDNAYCKQHARMRGELPELTKTPTMPDSPKPMPEEKYAALIVERLNQLMPVSCKEDGMFPIEEAQQVFQSVIKEALDSRPAGDARRLTDLKVSGGVTQELTETAKSVSNAPASNADESYALIGELVDLLVNARKRVENLGAIASQKDWDANEDTFVPRYDAGIAKDRAYLGKEGG